jgi:fido (protein-threonine AMPylation protein)
LSTAGYDSIETLLGTRSAVLYGDWREVTRLCSRLGMTITDERGLLDRLARQAVLHLRGADLVGVHHPRRAALPETESAAGARTDIIAATMRRSLAAVDGDRTTAAMALAQALPIRACRGEMPSYDIAGVCRAQHGHGPIRVIGVVRPLADNRSAVGDVGSGETLPVTCRNQLYTRGTPVEMVGRWIADGGSFESQSLLAVGELPDYPLACELVQRLCRSAGVIATPIGKHLDDVGQPDRGVIEARNRRRRGEWTATLLSAEILEHALNSAQLSLMTLSRVHGIVTDPASPQAGQLRKTPAVIKWGRTVTYRAPPVARARQETTRYLSELEEALVNGSAAHPATLAANAVASLTTSHPFPDGNGRLSRAVASWLLLRSGFRQRTDATLGSFLDSMLNEHFACLRHYQASPLSWHQLFYDAALTVFAPPRPQAHD